MAKFNYQESEHYGSAKSSYFSLKDDGNTARIRFLYRTMDDVLGVSVHEIQLSDGTTMDVECLRAYNEPVDKCPLCSANIKTKASLFVPVYDVDDDQVKIWTRGKTFFNKLSNLCSHNKCLVNTVFEVERKGAKGDSKTTYELYPIQTDNVDINDLPEVQIEDVAYKVKTFDELNRFLQTGTFDTPINRNNASQPRYNNNTNSNVNTGVVRRRTPASYNQEDTF